MRRIKSSVKELTSEISAPAVPWGIAMATQGHLPALRVHVDYSN